ncbi:hypothetical protein BGZ73_002452 [Actinomortierella ambigua]|nr:hypothetical protein BGZ73_002452 [Actinomortierella ambigua]
MSTAFEPRTSQERALIDSDPEGQLYLEARRQLALDRLGVDHNHHRLSRLSTITPPSSAPSSAASSIFHEQCMAPDDSSVDQPSSLPLCEHSPLQQQHLPPPPPHQPGSPPLQTPFHSPLACTSASSPHALPPLIFLESPSEHDSPSLASSSSKQLHLQLQQQQQPHHQKPPPADTFKTMRKARQYLVRKRNNEKRDNTSSSTAAAAASSKLSLRPNHGTFAPSSFEYQLTASLLALPSPSSTRHPIQHTVIKKKGSQTSFTKRTRRRSRQGSQPYRITIDTSHGATTSGNRHRGGTGGSGGLSSSRVDGKTTAAMLATEPMVPFSSDDSPPSTWSPSPPASPFSGSGLEGSAFVLRGKASASALSTVQAIPTPPTSAAARPGRTVEPLLDSLPNMSTAPFSPSDNEDGLEATTTITTTIQKEEQSPQPNQNSNNKNISIPLPPIPPSPPLPPIPPKTLSNLIAQYFPGSLPPPPPRVAGARPRRGSGIALHAVDAKSPPPTSTTTTPVPTPAHTPSATTPTFSPSHHVPLSTISPTASLMQLDVKTPTFGPAVLASAEDEPPVPTISASTRSALFHMAASMAAAAGTAALDAGSLEQGELSRSRSTVGTIATMSTTSGSSSPASLHPALVSTSAFGVPPYPPPSPKHPGRLYPPPNTTVAIPMPFPLPRMLTTAPNATTTSTAAAVISEEGIVAPCATDEAVIAIIPTTMTTMSPAEGEMVVPPPVQNHNLNESNNNTMITTTTTALETTAASPMLVAPPQSSTSASASRFSPLGLRPPPRRPSMTPHVSFEGRYPGSAAAAAAEAGTSTTTSGEGGSGVGLFYPTALKDATTAGPSGLLLGSKMSPRYYRAALYNSESSMSSTSSVHFKSSRAAGTCNNNNSRRSVSSSIAVVGGVGGERGIGGRRGSSRKGSYKGKRRQRRRKGSDDSLDHPSSSCIVVVSMTSSELDPLHYIENKPLPTVRQDPIFGEDDMDLDHHDHGTCGLFRSFMSVSPSGRATTGTTRTLSKPRGQWWVFRDQDGWMVGPWLFLFGFLFPPLWWIGGVYRAQPPKTTPVWPPMPKKKETEVQLPKLFQGVRGGSGGGGKEEEDAARREERRDGSNPPIQEEEEPEEDIVSTVLAPPPTKSSQHGKQPTEPSTAMIMLDMEQIAKEAAEKPAHGPWSVEHRATMVFQERMMRDRLAQRAKLEARWRTVNLVMAFLSLVATVAICAIVITVV